MATTPATPQPTSEGAPAPETPAATPAATPSTETPAATPTPGGTDDAATPAKKAPETYALTVPDDSKQYVGDDTLSFVEEVARANDWTQAEAQAELNAYADRAKAQATKMIATLETETKAHATWGGEHLAETQRLATLAVDKVFPKGHELRDRFLADFASSGGNVTLPFVAFLATVGQLMSDDNPAAARRAAPRVEGSGAAADRMYDHPTSRKLQGEAG